ncbi:MAG TPA: nuclease [Lachnospiraceae bacterium]|mgnify:FL=1|nr:MAG TPA: Nuclease [Caudoviricetes sp.]HCX91528.1 nuclease [Lachnospiraceae bacterium]
MREKEVEAALVKAAKKRNGVALKFVSPGLSGVPDRLVLLPDGKIGFIELKSPGKKMRLLQEKRKSQLERLGFLVFCLDSKEEVEVMLDAIQAA